MCNSYSLTRPSYFSQCIPQEHSHKPIGQVQRDRGRASKHWKPPSRLSIGIGLIAHAPAINGIPRYPFQFQTNPGIQMQLFFLTLTTAWCEQDGPSIWLLQPNDSLPRTSSLAAHLPHCHASPSHVF